MSAKLLRTLLCVLVAGAFWAPTASAGVFQMVEISGGSLENRLGLDNGDEGEDGDGEGSGEGDRTIQPQQPSQPDIHVELLEMISRFLELVRR